MFIYPTAYQKQKRITYLSYSVNSANLTTYTASYGITIPAGILFISIHAGSFSAVRNCGSMSLGGIACTFAGRINNTSSDVELWWVKFPTAVSNPTLTINMDGSCTDMATIIYRGQGLLSTPNFTITTNQVTSSVQNFGTINNLATGNIILGFGYMNGGSSSGSWNYPTLNVTTGYDGGNKALSTASARTTSASQNVTCTWSVNTLLTGIVSIVK